MKDLTKDLILKSKGIKVEPFDVEEWGGRIYLKTLSLKDRIEMADVAQKIREKGGDEKAVLLCVLFFTVCDSKGKRIFTSEKDAEALSEHSADVLYRIFNRSADLNKLNEESLESAKKK